MKNLKYIAPYIFKAPSLALVFGLLAWLAMPKEFAIIMNFAFYAVIAIGVFTLLASIILAIASIYYVIARGHYRLQRHKTEAHLVRVQQGQTVLAPVGMQWQVIGPQAQNHHLSLPSPQAEPEQQIARLPDKVLLPDILPLHGASLNNIVLGVAMNNEGQSYPITAPLSKLVHVAVGGSSGWGKSVFLRALAYQIAVAPELAELALVDLEAATFSPFAWSSRLRYQIADTETDANNVLGDLLGELSRRKELFKGFTQVEDLEGYNRLSDSPLPMIALMIDESTALLSDKTVEANIRTLVLRARKYGIYAILGGQDWKATSLDSAIKNQLSTKVQLKAQSKPQSRVLLDDAAAAGISQVGRAYAITPGNAMREIQTPYISLPMLMKALVNTGGMSNTPSPAPAFEQELVMDKPTVKQARVLELWGRGIEDFGEISKAVYGRDGGNQRALVEAALSKFNVL